MSIVTKITWATTEINDRNLHKVKEEKFEAATADMINKLYLELGELLWFYLEYRPNGTMEIQYPIFNDNGKYTGEEIEWLIEGNEGQVFTFSLNYGIIIIEGKGKELIL